MWEEWSQYINTDNVKGYSLFVEKWIPVTLEVHLTNVKIHSPVWEVGIYVYHSMTGHVTVFEGAFSSYFEAEAKAWKETQNFLKND